MTLLTDYGRAFAATLPLAGLNPLLPGGGHALPDDLVRSRDEVRVDPDHLARYARVCGFTLREHLPATYLNVLAFPVHISLMTDPKMPFGPVGLVHLTNEISHLRRVAVEETLSLHVTVSGLDPHPKGQTLTLHTQWRSGAEVVWTGRSTMLRRGPGDPDARSESSRVPDMAPQAAWKVAGDTGRRYAAVSGDRNPIHLYGLTAKAFGFPRAIAHGLWTKARCLAAVDADLPDTFDVGVRFRSPILLPSTVTFAADDGFLAVRNAASGAPHLDGKVVV